MCGIFGFVYSKKAKLSPDDIRGVFQKLSTLSDSRGKEASGIAVHDGTAIHVYKAAVRGARLVKDPHYLSIIQKAVSHSSQVISLIGHSRLETNGSHALNQNNQPIVTPNFVGIHNGICVNDGMLWNKIRTIHKKTDVDTEALLAYTDELMQKGESLGTSLQRMFSEMEGSASIAAYHARIRVLTLATNTGSLYYVSVPGTFFVFSSEAHIIGQVLGYPLFSGRPLKIRQLSARTAGVLDFSSLKFEVFSLNTSRPKRLFPLDQAPIPIVDHSSYNTPQGVTRIKNNISLLKKHTIDEKAVARLRRCARCILPETMPLISFDRDGVCNYCREHTPIKYQGKVALERLVSSYRKKDGGVDCIVALSGGRDSSYGLHYIKKVMKLNPVAYTYDWGMVTDIGRRNQARMVGKLGVEHILVSADLQKKRDNIRKNILAWLKKPDLGMVPLFMAGDKQAEFYAEELRKKTGIDLIFYCRGNELENEEFKWGYCGIRNGSPGGVLHDMSLWGKAQLAAYYGKEFLLNPGYLNSSLVDTAFAYFVAYMMPLQFTYLWHYIPWDEQKIISTLKNEYGWETEPKSDITWRIDDGSVAFYNYIFYKVQGFTENDTFRSNQIREGILSREQALRFVKRENQPRHTALQWYFNQLHLNGDEVLSKIDRIPTKY